MSEGESIIETRHLTKRYGPRLAVDNLTFSVRPGEIYGFLGLNGSGKTTTMRMLLGLVRPSSGTAAVLGRRPGEPATLRQIGSLVETPAFYPYLSGRDNLLVIAHLAGLPTIRVEEALEMVGLRARAGDAFRTYSLGMKQRLGVAGALVKNPHLLILDEPTNGLDVQGITDMAALIRALRARGRTVLLSSHQLVEVQALADRVGILREGRLVAEGTVEALRGPSHLHIRARPPAHAFHCLHAILPDKVQRDGDLLVTGAEPSAAGDLVAALVAAGVVVEEVRVVVPSLEQVFFALNEGARSSG